MNKKQIAAIMVAVVLGTVCLVGIRLGINPKFQAWVFVQRYGDYIEEKYYDGIIVSKDNVSCLSMTYYGSKYRHPMIEFDLCGFGIAPSSTYYGCFFSPDDVPLVYGQMNYTLVKQSEGYWTWQEENGDNHGSVAKIRDRWYYFSVSF
ncbi:MAG: hypothetical protein LUE20_07050 [Oscillospiraceae bacterium]|nr:hypothetical protein [Oscillospiraceae bacterium]